MFCHTLVLTAVPGSVMDTTGDREGCLNRLPSHTRPPPNPEPCSAWGSQELWPDRGDAQKTRRYCQLSGVCALMINGMDLTEAEAIKKRWQEYTEEL